MLDFDRYKVVTFDCFGTLIDWETGILGALHRVLANHDVTADDVQLLQLYAKLEKKYESGEYHRYDIVQRLVMTEMSLRLGFDAAFYELDCLSRSIKDWEPFADTVAALKALKSRYQLAIVSNIDDLLFINPARKLEIDFDFVLTAQQARAYKPSQEFLGRAFDRVARSREEILHVAESLYHDIAPARQMGVTTVWVNRRQGRPGATELIEVEPDLEVPDLASLVQLIGLDAPAS